MRPHWGNILHCNAQLLKRSKFNYNGEFRSFVVEFQKSWCKNVRGKVYQGRTVENIYVEEVKLFYRRCPLVPLPQDDGRLQFFILYAEEVKTLCRRCPLVPLPEDDGEVAVLYPFIQHAEDRLD